MEQYNMPDGSDLGKMILQDLATDRAPEAEEPESGTVPFPEGVNDTGIDDLDRPQCDATDKSSLHLWLARRIGVGELDHLFRRKGSLVRVIPGSVEPVDAKRLRAEIDYTFQSFQYTEKNGKQDVNFPLVAAENACGAVHRLVNARELAGITSVPLFRADGELIDTPGYDDVTQMLYQPLDGLKIHVPEEPSRQALYEAATLIRYPIAEFPFQDEADKANWIGVALTPLLRNVAEGPYKLVVVEAHQPGSGKGYLTGMLRKLHGGILRGALPAKEDEMRKTITTALLGAEGIVVFDNVKGTVSSPSLEALLTSDTWTDRLLGGNTDVTLPNDRLWVMTGNNASFGGDMARRILKIRLDAGPNPEQRTGFAIDNPIKWMDDHRGAYLTALLTIIRGWWYAGAPMPAATGSDSYARWRQIVSGILSFAGLGEEFDAATTRVAMSDEDEEWNGFLHAVRVHFGASEWTAAELAHAIGMSAALQQELPGAVAYKQYGAGFSTSLSNFLKNRNMRWYGDVQATRSVKRTKRGFTWRINTMS
jgi:hypothetical protein